MIVESLAPYLTWAKTRGPAEFDLAGSNVAACSIADLPGAREAVDVSAPNDSGYAPLDEAIARHYGVAANRIVSAHGCSGANFVAAAALAGPGDHVLIEQPSYDPLVGACRLIGARIERFDRPHNGAPLADPGPCTRRIIPATRLVMLTTPHNPSGARVDRAALIAIGRAASAAGAIVLVDEVYLDAANLGAGRPATYGTAALADGPFVVTNSLTKSYGLAGLRCGWLIAQPHVAERLRRARDLVENVGGAPTDRLGAHAFGVLDSLQARTRALLSANLATASTFLADQPRLRVAAPPGSTTIFPRVEGVTDTSAFAARLHSDWGVAVVPGRFFDAPAHVRINLGCRPDVLAGGLARIGQALSAWPTSSRPA
jgi:hypothetical protein